MVYVFGKAITDETLRAKPEYQGKAITLNDRAREALIMKNSEDRDVMVRQQVEKLMEKVGVRVFTVCLIYNATGDTLTLVTYRDWSGHIGFTPYPPKIENGQFGVFLHVGDVDTSDASSVGAVVYRGKKMAGEDCDWMQAWTNKKSNRLILRSVKLTTGRLVMTESGTLSIIK
ncbi:23 kDa jasmonate-induced protein-like isoform X2 [Durio zibethinus]|uniref:23 kDa jasmonate-induced protein-like isoform X2 n=1 Tax=Durio zibethinus TaxID=66656 RepID=A0A6P5Z9K6_DURZI|nr:23 kDa jasmonate-induced protein-like isoform X2 [Durio zibethinus]